MFRALGAAKDIDIDTSETSSYCSDDEVMEPKPKKQKRPQQTEQEGGNDSDGGGDQATSTYSKFKTQHEMEIGEAYKTGPERIQLDDLDDLLPFGTIV